MTKQTLSQFRATRVSYPSASREARKLYKKIGVDGPADPETVTTHFYRRMHDEACPPNASARVKKQYKEGYVLAIEYAPEYGYTYEWGQGGDSSEKTRAKAEKKLFAW